MRKKIELNEQFRRALGFMEDTDKHVFITGKAGTGKSTVLEWFRAHTKKKVVVLAPTGVAALNVKGQTIHSFFKFKPDITLDSVKKLDPKRRGANLYKKLDAIVIDEISMVRADLLDCVDKFMRLNGPYKKLPFGGVQMIFIGDLYQLPPVVTGQEKEIFKIHYPSPYFFDAKVFAEVETEFVELEKIYRQKDQEFIDILNTVRNNSAGDAELSALNQRLSQDFEPPNDDFYICLTTTNALSDDINEKELGKLSGKPIKYTGVVSGQFDLGHLPTDIELKVKKGAQVMLLNNDSAGRWVNGTVGKIINIEEGKDGDDDTVWVEVAGGQVEAVLPYTWEVFNFKFNENSGSLEAEMVGSFTQYPLRLAWAVTIHKSQGKTFDRVIIDIGRGTFAHGQLYVALSRCTSLSGMVLKRPLSKKHILMDWRVVRFMTSYQYKKSHETLSMGDRFQIIKEAIQNRKNLEIVYLKSNDEKSKRILTPESIGQMEYLGVNFIGVAGFDSKRQEERIFRVDRILEIKVV